MANTYTQIHIHAVFAVQNRMSLINKSWQEGYGAFSYGKSQISTVANYIETQERRHKGRTFREEYLEILKKFEIEYDEHYIFKDIGE
ncbi:MAG: transposase [Prevotellaceae bacterium]|jgi:hypothetical protein|nr:transposase [Prevotellaceae bacterium]